MLPQLIDAGVASFKIEGRMKSAEYVANVVGAYRMALDAPERKRQEAVAEAKELLKLSFGRVPTKGFLASHTPTDIATPSLKGATGRFLGEIRAIRGGPDQLRDPGPAPRGRPDQGAAEDRHGGSGLHHQGTLYRQRPRSSRRRRRPWSPYRLPFRSRWGTRVFKVSSETAFTMSESACVKKLEAVKGTKLHCRLTVTLAR